MVLDLTESVQVLINGQIMGHNNMSKKLHKAYLQNRRALKRAERDLRKILKETISSIEDRYLVRAKIENIRIKSFPSFRQKVTKNNWSIEESFWRCSDLIGGRVTCNNIADVYRFFNILKENIDHYHPINTDPILTQNHIDKPLEGGYRAIHVNFKLDINKNLNGNYIYVPCEVQVRSLLQHAWGELTHQDIYKKQEIPADLRARAKDIAEMLAAVDKIADDIRSRAMQEVSSSTKPPSLKNVSKNGLSWCFTDAFGRYPYDYVIEQALNICDHLDIDSLEKFSNVLTDTRFHEKLNNYYQDIWKMNVNMSSEDIFLTSLYSFGSSDKRAIRWMSNRTRRELEHMERETRQEILLSLPETIEEFIEYIESFQIDDDIERCADALGAIDECGRCSRDVVYTDTFAENILEYYEISEDDDEWEYYYQLIESTLTRSGVDTGDWDNPYLCTHCGAMMRKND